MSLGSSGEQQRPDQHHQRHHQRQLDVPPTDRRKIVAACVCLAIPVVALLWVPSYAREDPSIGGIPFFFWYQFVWVFLCSALTWTAYKLVQSARGKR